MDINRGVANLLRMRLEKLKDMTLNNLYSYFIALNGVAMIFAYLTNDHRLWYILFSSIGLYLLYTLYRFFLFRKLTIEIKVISNAERIQLSIDNIEKGFLKMFYFQLFNCSILALVGIYTFLNTMV